MRPGREELGKALALFSVLPHAPSITDTVVDVWAAVLGDAKCDPQDVVPAARALMQKLTAFPAPSVLADSCRELKRERLLNAPQLPHPTGTPITPEERDEILKGLKNPEFALEVIEGTGARKRYRIETEAETLEVDEARQEQLKRLKGGEL